MSKLTTKRAEFLYDIAETIIYATELGFQIVGGEFQRLKDVQLLYLHSKRIIGDKNHIKMVDVNIKNTSTLESKHLNLLAVDLEFFKDGIWINGLKRDGKLDEKKIKIILQPIGDYFTSLNSDNVWGGNWTNPFDPPHFQRN